MSAADGSLSVQPTPSGLSDAPAHSILGYFRLRPRLHLAISTSVVSAIPWVLLSVAWISIAFGQWWVLEGTECAGWILWGMAHQSLSPPVSARRAFFWANLVGGGVVAWGQTHGLHWEFQAMKFPASVSGGMTLAVAALWTGLYLLPWFFLVLLRFRRTPAAVLMGVIGMDWLRGVATGYDWVGFTLWGWDTWVSASIGSCLAVFCILWLARFFISPPHLFYLPARASSAAAPAGRTFSPDTTSLSEKTSHHVRQWGWTWIHHTFVWLPILLGWSFLWATPVRHWSTLPVATVASETVATVPPALLVVVETFAPVDHIPDWTPSLRKRLQHRLEAIQSMLDRHMTEQHRPLPESLVVWPEWGRGVLSAPIRGVTVSPFYTSQHGVVAPAILWQRNGTRFGTRGKWLLTPVGERPCLGILAPPATPYAKGHYPPFLFWQGHCIQSLLCVEGLHPDFWNSPADILTVSANWHHLSPHHRAQFRAILGRRAAQTGKTVILSAHGHPALVLTPDGPLPPLWVSEMIPDDHQPLWVRFRVFELPPSPCSPALPCSESSPLPNPLSTPSSSDATP